MKKPIDNDKNLVKYLINIIMSIIKFKENWIMIKFIIIKNL